VKCKWALLYIERWLTAPMEKEGLLIEPGLFNALYN
jgi:RNA-directed DNA polymerase